MKIGIIYDSSIANSIAGMQVLKNRYPESDLFDLAGLDKTATDAIITAMDSDYNAIYSVVKSDNADYTAEVLATAELKVTAMGSARERITVTVTDLTTGDVTTIANIISNAVSIEEDVDDIVAYINDGTNTHGFSAIKKALTTDTVVVSAPVGTGADGNAFALTYNVEANHTIAATIVDFGGGADETRATSSIEVTTSVTDEVYSISVNEGSGAFIIGTFKATNVSATDTAVGLVASIAAGSAKHGYSATNLAGVLTITAPKGRGVAPNGVYTTAGIVSTGGGAAFGAPTAWASGVTETQASMTVEITNGGMPDNLLTVYVDIGASTIPIGTAVGTGVSEDATAETLKVSINDGTGVHGFTATRTNHIVTVKPARLGTATDANAYVTTQASDTISTFTATYAGKDFSDLATGVDGVAYNDGQLELSQVTSLNAKTVGNINELYGTSPKTTARLAWEEVYPLKTIPYVIHMLGGYLVDSSLTNYVASLRNTIVTFFSDADDYDYMWKKLLDGNNNIGTTNVYTPAQDLEFLKLMCGQKTVQESLKPPKPKYESI